tara:strand:+ start:160 stop:279 length:120 start_codon:yes stop_codon:yes gene_type:complete
MKTRISLTVDPVIPVGKLVLGLLGSLALELVGKPRTVEK